MGDNRFDGLDWGDEYDGGGDGYDESPYAHALHAIAWSEVVRASIRLRMP